MKRVDKIAYKKVKKKMELNCAKIKSLYSCVSLHSIYGVVNSMNHNQKECVRSLGFGSLIDMKTQSILAKLCYFVVDSFDPLEMVIKTEVSNILVTREDVNRVLGLPMGVDQLNSVDLRGNEEWYEIWKDQFKKPLSLITPNDTVYKIIERCEAYMVFVANFIILVCTCFGSCNKQGACNLKLLPYLSESYKLDNFDWCTYVLNCVKEEKLIWGRSDIKTFFNGPSVFLTVCHLMLFD